MQSHLIKEALLRDSGAKKQRQKEIITWVKSDPAVKAEQRLR